MKTIKKIYSGSTYILFICLMLTVSFVIRAVPVQAISQTDKEAIFRDSVHHVVPSESQGSTQCTAGLVGGENPLNAAIIWNFFTQKGLTPIATAGIMGNFSQESSGFDPAIKQDYTKRAIPDNGDGVTGYGIAQWTSPAERQAGLFAMMREAGMEKYYGEGWGNPEIDKSEMPRDDVEKLLNIELNYAWEGDSSKISAFKDKINATTSVEGDNGSTMVFHRDFERSKDDASQLQERITDAKRFLAKYGGGSGCSGEAGSVSTVEDAILWAEMFITETKQEYHIGGNSLNERSAGSGITQIYHIRDDNRTCWGGAADCHQCTAVSGWFVTTKTGYPYAGGDGGSVVENMKHKGVPTGSKPEPFSVFSYYTGEFGHTGVVLAVLSNGDVITLENNWPEDDDERGGTLIVRQYNIKAAEPGVTFAYVGDKMNTEGFAGDDQ